MEFRAGEKVDRYTLVEGLGKGDKGWGWRDSIKPIGLPHLSEVRSSLDRFERFWPDAGLSFSNGEAIKSSVREALRTKYAMDAAHRARVAINPDAPMDMVYRNRVQTLPKG